MFDYNNIKSYPFLEKFSSHNHSSHNHSSHNHFKEQIILLYYNLTRKNETSLGKIEECFESLLKRIKINKDIDGSLLQYVEIIYKLIVETRDCFYGKGEHHLSYMLIHIFYKYYPTLAIQLIYKFVDKGSHCTPFCIEDAQSAMPFSFITTIKGRMGVLNEKRCNVGYGSWRDMKYLCQYVREHSVKGENDSIIVICIELMNHTLKKDLEIVRKSKEGSHYREQISSVSKWIPRENKKFDWLYRLLVINWFHTFRPDFFGNVKDNKGYYLALDKAKMIYRKQISSLNNLLDTTEIKMCSKQLDKIVPNNIPQICLQKYSEFRTLPMSSQNSLKHSSNSSKLSYFIKEAYLLLENSDSGRIDILNHQWKKMSEAIGSNNFDSYIPFLDVSFQYDKESFYSGIALAFLISEHSSFRDRIMVIDQQPMWINLEDHTTFFSKFAFFNNLIESYHGTTANIMKGLELLVDSAIETVSNMSIVFLHGEQSIDYKHVITSFINIRIIFWNLSQTYIDDIFIHKNCFYMSGFSPSLLSNLYILQKHTHLDAFQFISFILGKKYDDIKIIL